MHKVSLSTAEEYFEMINDETFVYYNTKTGEFDYYNEYLSDEDLEGCDFESDEWLMAPDYYEIDDYRMMQEFTQSVSSSDVRGQLLSALNGKGAFSRFKDAVHRLGWATEWYSFKQNAYAEIVKEWCTENNLIYENDL